MNPVYSLRSTTHSKNFSDVKEFLFPPCDSLLPSHQREDVTYQWYSGLDQFWYNDHSLLDQKYDPTQPLMAGHEKQPLPLAFFFQSFPFQTSLHPDHHHFCKILCRRFFFNGHLTLDLASLLYNKCKCNWFPLCLCFLNIFLPFPPWSCSRESFQLFFWTPPLSWSCKKTLFWRRFTK